MKYLVQKCAIWDTTLDFNCCLDNFFGCFAAQKNKFCFPDSTSTHDHQHELYIHCEAGSQVTRRTHKCESLVLTVTIVGYEAKEP